MIDFGLNDINVDLGLPEEPKKKSNKPYDPKDPFQMNQMADDMKNDTKKMVDGIKSDYENFKKEYQSIKNDIMPLYTDVKNYVKAKKDKKESKNIDAFRTSLKAQKDIKEEQQTPKSLKERYPLMKSHKEKKSDD